MTSTCHECGLPIGKQQPVMWHGFGFVHAECYALMPKTKSDWRRLSW